MTTIDNFRDTPAPDQAWTSDGKFILVPDRPSAASPHSIFAISVESGEKRQITQAPAGFYSDSGIALSPDGKTLAFIRSSAVASSDIYTLPVQPLSDGVKPKKITNTHSFIGNLMWTGDGRELLFIVERESHRMWRIPAKGGEPRMIEQLSQVWSNLTISRQGDRLAFSDFFPDLDLERLELPAKAGDAIAPPKTIASSTRNELNARISPDGKKIAFASDRSGAYEIWTADADGSNPVQLTSLGAHTGTPRWSPDSQKIVFDSRVNGNADIYIVNSGGGKPRQLTVDASDDQVPNWSRDGQSIYFVSNRGGSFQIWKMPQAGGTARQITKGGAFDAVESTDGKSLYFAREWGRTSLWQIPSEGGIETKVLDDLSFPLNFDVVSDGIYYFAAPGERNGPRELRFYSFAASRSATVLKLPQGGAGLSLSPDRRWALIVARAPDHGDNHDGGELPLAE